ncbi:hypothetical protein [Leptospira sp. severe_002]|nr:hypothetical protein [Leptospira sp. severe_002]
MRREAPAHGKTSGPDCIDRRASGVRRIVHSWCRKIGFGLTRGGL